MYRGSYFWFDVRVYLAVATALLAVIVYYNYYVAILGAVLLYVLYLYGRERQVEQQKQIQAYLNDMSKHIDQASLYALQKLPLAIAIINESGILYWHNEVMANWVEEETLQGESMSKVWPGLSVQEMWGHESVKVVQDKGKYFQVICKPMAEPLMDKHELMILYITDITSFETVRDKYRLAMPVLAQIQIDNYDDVLKGLNEAQRTSILAEVNQTLADWITEIDGFLKKYTEDTYIAAFNRQALDKLLNDKFEILDKVRDIHGGNKNPVTLSIGVASEDSSIAALEQRAQAGLDLALGRGGDQACVYIENKVQFYGGKAKPVEKNTRVKARMVAQAIREVLQDTEHVMVMGHFGEDFDSLGAALGVARMALHLGKRVNIVTSQSSLAFSKLQEQFTEGSVYEDIFISPSQALLVASPQSLVFVVDTHRPEMTAAPELLNQVEKVVVIDHHRRSEVFIKNPILVYLEPSASSTSELVTELVNYFDEKLDLTRLDASALYAGIIVDTKNFAVQTGVRTFDAASYLRRSGADPTLVRYLFRVDFETVKSRAGVLQNAEMLPGGVVLAVCPPDAKNAQIIAAQSADMLLSIEGIRVSFVLFTMEDGVGISARSNGEINVQVLMEELGGGGHHTVAGVQLRNTTFEAAKAKIIDLIKNKIEESGRSESNPAARS